MSLTPIIINGQPTCPQGFALSPDGTQCLPISPPISVDVTGVGAAEIDYSNQARQLAGGYKSSGILGDLATMLWTWLARHLQDVVAVAAGVYDKFLTVLAQFFFAAQGQRNPAYFELVAALMTDLTGISVDGSKMFHDFQAKGRLASMRDIGGALFNALSSEFAGVEQTDAGSAWKVSPGAGLGGLPVHDYVPGDGVNAARALWGFATSFAVREGNTDMLADYLPYGTGRWFKDFAEDFSKSVGLTRLIRTALGPFMHIQVALPLQYDLHTQYRPTLLGPSEAVRAFFTGALDPDVAIGELRKHGYSDARIEALKSLDARPLSIHEYRTALAASGRQRPADYMTGDVVAARLGKDRYDKTTVEGWLDVLDLDPARRLSLTYVERYVLQFLEGHLTVDAINAFLAQAESASGVLLTAGEFASLKALVTSVSVNPVLRIRHLNLSQLQLAYIDGTISLDELSAHMTQLGYTADDITIFTLETLFKAQQRVQAAATKAAKKKTGTSTPGSILPGIGTIG